MRINQILQILLITLLTLTTGFFTHQKLYAKAQPVVVMPPQEPPARTVKLGMASWYSEQSPGINKRTANNEIFNDAEHTAAMWDVPFNQRIKVTNTQNGKSVIVRVNDRGPHRRFVRKGRVIDLTKEAFREIGGLKEGLIEVELEFL